MEVSEYERHRLANIARNNQKLESLGLRKSREVLEGMVQKSSKKKKGERGVSKKAAAAPTRRSTRKPGSSPQGLVSLPDDFKDPEEADSREIESKPAVSERPFKGKRPSEDQWCELRRLGAADGEKPGNLKLTAAEKAAAGNAQASLCGGIDGQSGRSLGKGYWPLARAKLQDAGVRRPSWVQDLEDRMRFSSPENKHQTMFGIEKAVGGLGLGYKRWPADVGILVGTDEALTLSTDTDLLRYQGRKLENKYGKDLGNGWAYNHALGYVKKYQALRLHDLGFSGLFDPSKRGWDGPKSVFQGKSMKEAAEEEEEEGEEGEDDDAKTRERQGGAAKVGSAGQGDVPASEEQMAKDSPSPGCVGTTDKTDGDEAADSMETATTPAPAPPARVPTANAAQPVSVCTKRVMATTTPSGVVGERFQKRIVGYGAALWEGTVSAYLGADKYRVTYADGSEYTMSGCALRAAKVPPPSLLLIPATVPPPPGAAALPPTKRQKQEM